MVSTRNHPRNFPPPDLSPSKSSSQSNSNSNPNTPQTPSAPSTRKRRSAPPTTRGTWAHTPSNLTIGWLLVSLPLVLWDTGYVMLRPHSMPGGKYHWPLWTPYELYGTIDHIYGWPAWEANNGFTAAQGGMNLVETAIYVAYLWIVVVAGREEQTRVVEGRGAPGVGLAGWFGMARVVSGREASVATLLGFSGALMTLSKTILYFFNEAFTGFHGISHNSWSTLLFLWIIPNGAWLVFSTYMTYVFGTEILEGLDAAGGGQTSSSLLAIKDE